MAAPFNPLDCAQAVLKRAVKEGVAACEISVRRDSELEIHVLEGNVVSLRQSTNGSAMVRLWRDDGYALAHSRELSEDGLHAVLEKAMAWAEEDHSHKIAPVLAGQTRLTDVEIFDPQILSMTPQDKINYIQEVEKQARGYGPRIKHVQDAVYLDRVRQTALVTSKGFAGEYPETLFGGQLSVTAAAGDNVIASTGGCWRRFFADMAPPAALAETACSTALMLISARPCFSGEYGIVFDGATAAPALLEATLAEALRADLIANGQSVLASAAAAVPAANAVTVIHDPGQVRGVMSRPFDDEGTVSSRVALIQEGKFLAPLDGRETAAAAKRKPAGSAVWFADAPVPRPAPVNLVLAPGKQTREQLIAGIGQGILASQLTVGGVDLQTGKCALSLAGRMIRGGEVAEPVSDVLLMMDFLELWRRVVAVGSDLSPSSGRWPSPVSSPSFRVTGLRITGR